MNDLISHIPHYLEDGALDARQQTEIEQKLSRIPWFNRKPHYAVELVELEFVTRFQWQGKFRRQEY